MAISCWSLTDFISEQASLHVFFVAIYRVLHHLQKNSYLSLAMKFAMLKFLLVTLLFCVLKEFLYLNMKIIKLHRNTVHKY